MRQVEPFEPAVRTRITDLSAGNSIHYDDRRQRNGARRSVDGPEKPAAWPTVQERDAERACSTTRRRVVAATKDLARLQA